ncbi:MAG: S41 family peptidase [Clostridia bacterium]
MRSKTRTILYFAATALISASIAVMLTVTLTNNAKKNTVVLSADEYNKLGELRVLNEIIDKITTESLTGEVDRGVLVEGAANGMLKALGDNYAQYYTAEEYEEYLSKINGEYSGIGILVGQPGADGAPVLDVYEGTPAEISGMKPGDIIVAVDGASVSGMQLEELTAVIDREIGDSVEIKVTRDGIEKMMSVANATINIKRVHSFLFNEYTGYIRIDMFTGNCVEEFDEAFRDLTERGMKSLVIDLRNNPGGALDDVVDIADTLLGECVIVNVKGTNGRNEHEYKSSGKALDIPLAVIVNENSASASEILASAVKDNGAGAIVGITTYGKGVVQTTMRLDTNGAWLKLTTDAYYTPNGNNINGVGVEPDIRVELPEEIRDMAITQIKQTEDKQLWAALDEVRERAAERQRS